MPSQFIELYARTKPRVGSILATCFAITSSSPSQSLSLFLQKHCVKVWCGPVLSDHSREGLLISHHRPDGSSRFIGHGD